MGVDELGGSVTTAHSRDRKAAPMTVRGKG